MPKSCKFLRKRLQSGDRESFGNKLPTDLGSLPGRSRGFAGFWRPYVFFVFCQKMKFLKTSIKENRRAHDTFLTTFLFFEIAKVTRFVVSSDFRCGACW